MYRVSHNHCQKTSRKQLIGSDRARFKGRPLTIISLLDRLSNTGPFQQGILNSMYIISLCWLQLHFLTELCVNFWLVQKTARHHHQLKTAATNIATAASTVQTVRS